MRIGNKRAVKIPPLNLPTTVNTYLFLADVRTVKDVLELGPQGLVVFKGIAWKSLVYIAEELERNGLILNARDWVGDVRWAKRETVCPNCNYHFYK